MSPKTVIVVCLLSVLFCVEPLLGEEKMTVLQRQRIAVALNYSRASFHRIRKNPAKRVLIEEQEQILNNLNLSQIDDAEVIKLYTSVLDEIGRVQIAEKERKVIKERFHRDVQEEIVTTAMSLGAQVATFQYVDAVKTGANSWWDYRSISWQRDFDTFRIEKSNMLTVVSKSSQFLDTFWKLTRKRDIPDHWLVRSDDLDELDKALKEKDLETRLRILHRMERFMAYYPPYWYYIGRAEQKLGKIKLAASTYEKMAKLGDGHFRKDEMLAAGLTNLALIQEYSGDKRAEATAQAALQQATTSWQANLICAWIIEQHHNNTLAEDTILRNVDLHLEQRQSKINLVALYYRNDELKKLSQQLSQPKVVASLPMSLLIPCAAKLQQQQKLPVPVVVKLSKSLHISMGGGLGRTDLVMTAQPQWQLQTAGIALRVGKQEFSRSTIQLTSKQQRLRFSHVGQVVNKHVVANNKEQGEGHLSVIIQYPATPPIQLHLQHRSHKNLKRLAFQPSFQIASIDVVGFSSPVTSPKNKMTLTSTSTRKKSFVKVQTFKPATPQVMTISLDGRRRKIALPVPPAPQAETPHKKTPSPPEHFLPGFRPASRR